MAVSGRKAGAIGFIPIIVIASVFGAYLDLARLTPSSSPESLVLSASANPTNIVDEHVFIYALFVPSHGRLYPRVFFSQVVLIFVVQEIVRFCES